MRQSQPFSSQGSATAYGYAAREPQDAVEPGDIPGILLRRLLLILVVAACFVLPAILYIMAAPSLYSATTSILIDPRQGRSLSVETPGIVSADAGQLESQLKLVTSQTVLRRVVENEKLLADPEFGPQPPGLLRRILSVIGRSDPSGNPQDRIDAAVDALGKNISVRRSERTYVIDIQVSARDAAKSARLANAIAKAYMEDASEARSEVVRVETDYVRDRMVNLQGKLQEAEARVAAYKEKNRIFDASGKLVNDEQITNLSNSIVIARTRTAEAKSRLDQVQRVIRNGKGIESLSEAQKAPTLDRLRGQFADIVRLEANLRTTLGPRHPQLLEVQQQAADTRRLVTEELRRVAGALENEHQVAKNAEANLEVELERLRTLAGTTNQSLPQLRELERNVDAQRSAFDKLSKAGDTISQQGADTPVARVIAMALPPDAPSSPRKLPILGIALTAGLGFGIGAALLAESGARRRSTPGHRRGAGQGAPAWPGPLRGFDRQGARLRRLLARLNPFRRRAASLQSGGGLSSPAHVPAFRPERIQSPYTAAIDDPTSRFAGAIRSLAATQLADTPFGGAADGATRFVYVTSVEAGVGKSVVTSNLAYAAAASGARILIIDANLDNPTLSMLGSEGGSLGLIPALGRMRPAFALETSAGSLFLLSASEGDAATAERLAKVLPHYLEGDVDRNFDLVIIDGASIARRDADDFPGSADRILLIGAPDIAAPASIAMAARALGCEPNLIMPVAIDLARS